MLIILGIIGAVLAGLSAGGYLWFRYTVKAGLFQISGEATVTGLTQDIEIIRDTYGVPHIYAGNESDLYFGFGYAMAQDRFWQMEFYRRLGRGRLSEVFGRDSVDVDQYFRMLTASGIDNTIDEDLVPLFTSFATGVNAYLESHQDRLPIEFKLLGYRPEPWGVDDYLSILTFVNWGLSMGWHVDLTAARVLDTVGETRMRAAFPVFPEDDSLMVRQGQEPMHGLSGPFSESMGVLKKAAGPTAVGGSNNWVVSGTKSATDKPILANDPHLQLTNPSIWWEVHLVCPTIDVSGVAIAGLPGIIAGHNHHVAWGITNVQADDVDFYIEKINPDNPHQYWFVDRWETMRVVRETIRVKDDDPVTMAIRLTRHGPIVEEGRDGTGAGVISARWAPTEVPQSSRATYLLLKAQTVSDVTDALRYWTTPGLNFVFADRQGNIGYWCCATIPLRPAGDGLVPVAGWTGECEWKGYIPFDDRPHSINPPSGFVATANNKVGGKDFDHVISRYWEPVDRITRIRHMLRSEEKLSVDMFKEMQWDVYSVLASELTPALVRVLEERLTGEEARKAVDILSAWDYRMERDSVGACLFEVTYRRLMENIFRDEMGGELFEAYLRTASFPPRALRELFRRGRSPWFDDVSTLYPETLNDMIERSFSQALNELSETLGDNMARWKWGRIHSLTFKHVLGRKRPLNWIFNLGPYPIGGSHLTVNNGQYRYEDPYAVEAGPSFRMIVDLSDMSHSVRVIPTGESGHLGSRHYKDQVPLYLHGQYHPNWTDRDEVLEHGEARLVLKPAA